MKRCFLLAFLSCLLALFSISTGAEPGRIQEYPVADGWAKNSVNTTIFRLNSVVSHGDTQYISFYDEAGTVVLGKRKHHQADWVLRRTHYTGNVRDAHNGICIMVDGDGYLHVSWDHHGHPLRYCKSVAPGSLELTDKMPMTGLHESRVTYPEFYRIPGGDLLFFYRDGSSGNGNLMLNHYDTQKQRWSQIQSSFIHGEGQRNAYWQAAVDSRGVIHLSWVWRESGDVATNHDMAYAMSDDGGITWKKSTGEVYTLPITAANAEYAARIPQNSELINQTSMSVDSKGRPYIVTYWRAADSAVPQYHIIYHTGETWKISQVTQRTTPFSLKGGGTRRILISRPKLLIRQDNGQERGYMLFRDAERGNRASLAICEDLRTMQWYYKDLSDDSLGQWEPSYDTERWREQGILSLFAQKVGQGEGETTEDIPPQKIRIIEWVPGL